MAEDLERTVDLVRAATEVAADLDLEHVLDRIVTQARLLTGARYGALAVIESDGRLSRFVTQGVSDEVKAAIGRLPRGEGVLGEVIRTHHPLRLPDLREHPSSVGFPAHHPPMRTFLGVPVVVRGEVFGNLYLTDKADGEPFGGSDERNVVLLATLAGTAIANARRYQESERRRRWVEASAEITTGLLGRLRPADAVRLVLRKAREMTDSQAAILAVEDDAGELVTRYLDGTLPTLAPGSPLRDLRCPSITVPFTAPAGAEGRLVVVWADEAQMAGSRVDLAAVESFAAQAGLALDRVQVLADRVQLAVLEDRERIARDLHDVVIQRLFATGLGLQSAQRGSDPGRVNRTLTQAVDDLDETIREIRATIFGLRHRTGDADIRGVLADLVAEASANLGLAPRLTFTGPVASAVDDRLADHLVAVVSEALSNAARHAEASTVAVDIDAREGTVSVCVTDDGVGISPERRESGLRNLQRRADEVGGTFAVSPQRPHGTILTWAAPIHATQGQSVSEKN